MEARESGIRRRRRGVLITGKDRTVLELAAEHRLILAEHAAALLEVSPSAAISRLRRLTVGGYLSKHRLLAGQPSCYQVTRAGLDVIDSALPRPRIDVRGQRHDTGLAWLWLAARRGTFGPLREVLSERTLRARDGRRQADIDGRGQAVPSELEGPLGVRLGGIGPGGRERLHYPDLLLITPQGRRIAVELELSSKGRGRRERILAGYAADARIDAVLYMTDQPVLAQAIRSSARRLGAGSLVHVQCVRQPAADGSAADAGVERTRSRNHRAGERGTGRAL